MRCTLFVKTPAINSGRVNLFKKMVRISGINLPDQRIIGYALTVVYGIGPKNAQGILVKAQVPAGKRVKDLTEEEVKTIQHIIDTGYMVEGDLRRNISDTINRLRVIGTYRGRRHAAGLPSRGQRTRSNARTRRGKRKTVGAMKKDDRAKVETPVKQ